MDIGGSFCNSGLIACRYTDSAYINFGLGVLVSACWHLLLLQYVNNKDSEFVRSHGRRALTQAGIRTAIPFFGIAVDYLLGAEGAVSCLTIIALLIIWGVNTATSKKNVERELGPVEKPDLDEIIPIPPQETPLSTEVVATEMTMTESDSRKPEEILIEVYQDLKSNDDVLVLLTIESLQKLPYSSEAVRRQLEFLAAKSPNKDIRKDALAALNLPAVRTVQKQLNFNKLDPNTRQAILREIRDWENSSLIEMHNAEIIRRRYDYDLVLEAPRPQPTVVPVQPVSATPPAETPAPVAPTRSQVPPEPRPSLLQTLTSEASIKIYLYLGAFFVIAAAAILGAVVPELRLPILILGTFIFGGLAVVIKKRLPQPSFALFIVFSFLLTITANSLEESLRAALNYPAAVRAGYWVVVFLIMAAIWSGGTRLYESRLFSITAFGSLVLALYRVGDMFNVPEEIDILLVNFAAVCGLAGVWVLKVWHGEKFALPLFLTAQVLQAVILIASLSIFGIHTFNPSHHNNLWHLVSLFAWVLACVFFILSNQLYPFAAFPWLAAGTLIPMPWFIATAFDLESFGSTIVLFVWGVGVTVVGEALYRFEAVRKYSLPILLAALSSLALGILTGFAHETWLGMSAALGFAILSATLHILRSRWPLWVLALLNFVVAYFSFFILEAIQPLGISHGVQATALSLLFLLPDLLLRKDWNVNPAWRLPLRIFSALFTLYSSIVLLAQNTPGEAAVCYLLFAIFLTAYALAYRKALIGYLPAVFLTAAIIFGLEHFNLDLWLPVLTVLSILYFAVGNILRAQKDWSAVLRFSGLTLGVFVSLAALIVAKQTGGWYVLVIGLLFVAEMALQRNGYLEPGAPILFSIGAFLILFDLDVNRFSSHLLAYSLIWLIWDLTAHLTFNHSRPLNFLIRVIGGTLALLNYGFLFSESDLRVATIGYAMYTLLFLTVSLVYRHPRLFYAFTGTLPLFIAFLFRSLDYTQWIHPVIIIAILYYAAGFLLRKRERAQGWDQALLNSGLGLGTFVSVCAPILGGLDASLPVAAAATLWAVEAWARKNVWLAFPANGLYLLAYFIILLELKVDEPQFFSIGTALFGLIQHYLLTRAGSKAGTFVMGMFSQFVLLGTTYIQLVGKSDLSYFFLMFLQSLAVLVYGIVIRSRSLTFFPIGFVVLGVVTVVYSALKDIGSIFLIGCTGIILLMLGILAVLLRERIAKFGEQLSDWQA